MGTNNEAHQALIKATKQKVTKAFPRSVRLFDRVVGHFYAKRVNEGVIDYTPFKIGKPGQCDDYAMVACGILALGKNSPVIPVHVEIEFKTGSGVLNPEQVIWQTFCKNFYIPYFLVRENTDLVNELKIEMEKRGLFIWL